ncbi:MAG: alpha/beta fold hydrolase [Planctomycetes bacterium]|nr:alpha/beta fold hydrolase [Planctomycetota bacterium]
MSASPLRTTARRLPGLRLREHVLSVPLDHAAPDGETLEVFAREVVRSDRRAEDLPALLFLQGGPGFAATRAHARSGWVGAALERFRVVLLDQRGTGRSTPVGVAGLVERGDADAQADYLRHFRADSIVADAELLRRALLGDAGRWVLLGQSYGGFCSVTYLSRHPESLAGAMITGGLPGLDADADEVYRETYALMARKNARFAKLYPQALETAERVAAHLAEHALRLPDGAPFHAGVLQALGLSFGMSDGLAPVADLLELAFEHGARAPRLSQLFLKGVQHHAAFDTNPIYALLHEMCYTQGAASRWAAERVRAEFPAFDPARGGPLHFTGEMVYPWVFAEGTPLAPVRGAAERLAARDDWPRLYDAERLARNEVPVAALVYHDDAYVPRRLSLETADRIRGCETWVTSELEHNGLRAEGPRVLAGLLERLDL